MSRRAARCTEADIKRAIRAAKASGVPMAVKIDRDGDIRLVPVESSAPIISYEGTPIHVRGALYFVHSPLANAIKIGFSTDFASRFRVLCAGTPLELLTLGTIEGTMEDERDLHRKFADLRLNGEWFRADQKLLDHIAQLNREA